MTCNTHIVIRLTVTLFPRCFAANGYRLRSINANGSFCSHLQRQLLEFCYSQHHVSRTQFRSRSCSLKHAMMARCKHILHESLAQHRSPRTMNGCSEEITCGCKSHVGLAPFTRARLNRSLVATRDSTPSSRGIDQSDYTSAPTFHPGHPSS